ncbi:MAG: 50S ribosomal protein L25 [Candidatus Omnitrophica bacterium]|nr:50S ribosomal protein L25 [Candidatus Omnitrophota bacterium]
MEQIELNFQTREENEIGKQGTNRLRGQGFIPAIIYSAGEKSVAIKLDKKELKKIDISRESIVLNLVSEKGKKTVLIKEVQHHPVSDAVLHIDFNHISLHEKIEVKVPVVIKGEAPGVKVDGGVLEHLLWEVEVECLPTNIPEKFEADVSGFNIGDFVYIKDLSPPSGVKIINDPETAVISVAPPRKEEVKEEAVEEVKEEPELIRKEKKEEVVEETKEKEGETKEEKK